MDESGAREISCGQTIHKLACRSAQPLDQQSAVVTRLHFEIGHRLDEVREAGVAVVARGEARHRLGALAELGQRGTLQNNLVKENYVTFRLGFTLNDRWFQRYQYD